jgi:hypothetical protein
MPPGSYKSESSAVFEHKGTKGIDKASGFLPRKKAKRMIRKAKERDGAFYLRALLGSLVLANGNGRENREGRQGHTLQFLWRDVPKIL